MAHPAGADPPAEQNSKANASGWRPASTGSVEFTSRCLHHPLLLLRWRVPQLGGAMRDPWLRHVPQVWGVRCDCSLQILWDEGPM